MELTQSSAQKRLADLHMDDMPVMEFTPTPAAVAPDWYPRYRQLRREFMKSLIDSVEDLAFLNLSQDEFMDLIMGKKMPKNLTIRLRVPLTWGGKLSLDNMFLCRTFPHSHNMDRFIIDQGDAKKIWLPNPAHKVYVPAHTASGGDGGNATEDRLAQMAAQIAAGRGME